MSVQRQDLILQYFPLVKKIAYRLIKGLPNHVHVEDLINVGMVGLIEAIDKYNPENFPAFASYAQIRIQGAMLDDLRQQDWVPRSVRDRSNQIAKAKKALITKLNREPSQDEIAEFLYMSPADFQHYIRKADVRVLLSTEDTIGENLRIGDVIPDNNIDALDSEQETQMKKILHDAIKQLKPREQIIIQLYYFENYTCKQIAMELDVTESRVSQLHASIRKKLERSLYDMKKDL